MIKTLFQHIVGVLLLILSLGMYFDKAFIGATLMLIGGLVCVGFTRRWIEKKLNFSFSRKVKYWLAGIGVMAFPVFVPHQPPVNAPELPKAEAIAAIPAAPLAPPAPVKDNQVVSAPIVAQIPQEKVKPGVVAEPVIAKPAQAQASNNLMNTSTKSKVVETPTKSRSLHSGGSSSKSSSSGGRAKGHGGYMLGPRGGCFYMNAHGNKTYVDHSFCR